MKGKVFDFGFKTYKELQDPFYTGIAAQIAFYLFLSALPCMTLVSELLGIFSVSMKHILEWASQNLSNKGMDTVSGYFSVGKSKMVMGNIMLFCTTIWSASKAQYALNSISDHIMGKGKKKTGYIGKRFRSLIFIAMIILILVISLVIIVYAPVIFNVILGKNEVSAAENRIWTVVRWIMIFALYFGVILIIYYVSPSRKIRLKRLLPGAVFSSVGFIVVTVVYSAITAYNRNGNIIYGSLSNVVFLLVWLWLLSWIMLLGMVLNKMHDPVFKKREESRTERPGGNEMTAETENNAATGKEGDND